MVRKIFNDLYRHLDKKQCTLIIGARQTGKTTLLKNLQEKADSDGLRTYFFNLEQKDVLTDFNDNPLNLLRYISNTKDKKYIFIDEIQYLDDPSNFIKLIYDEHSTDIKLVVTGSSAFYLDEKFNDSLAGRKRIFNLYTCSFDEYLELSEKCYLLSELKRIVSDPDARSTKLAELNAALDEFIIYGGYPAVICESDYDEKIELLKELRDSYLKRDVDESGIVNQDTFYKLYTLLSAQSGSQVNISELSKTLRISSETVEHYIHILQKCFHISLVKPFYRNIKKEVTKMPKVYVMDTGMRNCMINYFPDKLGINDDGALFENSVYRILMDRYSIDDIKTWRTSDQKEIDFIVDSVKNKLAYEVKYNTANIKQNKYKVFEQTYPEYKLNYISKEPFSEDILRTLFGTKL